MKAHRHSATLSRPLRRTLAALLAVLLPLQAAATDAAGKPNSFGNVADEAPRYRVYTYRQQDGVVAFTDKVPARQRSFSVMEFSCYACDPNSKVNWRATRLFTNEYSPQIAAAARRHGVDPALVRALIHAESGFNPSAVSRKGAIGLMQLMPGTASDMGVADPFAAQQNIDGGVKYLAMLLGQYRGDVTLATAAYNAGPGAVAKYGGVPPFAETRTYVQRVKLLHERYRGRA
ncbi:MAG: Membrane-bound lytic murein transglycosylase F [Pseudomonadales bacterium]|nr:Membrane-bound lytic murein transglycosylase F [Pseudomonadales bacterium]